MIRGKRIVSILLVSALFLTGIHFQNGDTVMAATKKLRCINISSRKAMYRNSTFVIKTNMSVSKVKYASKNKRIATVTRNGKITAKGVGSTIIAVRYGRQQKNIRLTVTNYRLRCTNISSKKAMYRNRTFTIKTNAGRRRLKFYSNNRKVATVSSRGTITAKQKGTATIAVKYGNQIKKISLTVKILGQYSPTNVAKLANQKLLTAKNASKKQLIYIPDMMKDALKNGQVSQEEYEKYRYTGGTGYFTMYFDTNLTTTRSIDGTRLKSESAIANEIKAFYTGGDATYFYIKYAGVKKIKNKNYYQFNLYQA